jgi:hypothetical protein
LTCSSALPGELPGELPRGALDEPPDDGRARERGTVATGAMDPCGQNAPQQPLRKTANTSPH